MAGILALGAAGILAGCGGDKAAKSAAPAAQAPKKIVVGLDDSFPPMGFKDDNGKIVGFDIDLASAVGKEMGVEVEFKPIDWASKEAELSAGRVDALWNGLTITEERKKNVDFSKPYMNNEQVVIVLKDSDIQKPEDLAGKVVATQEGSTGVDAINKHPDVKKTFKGGEPKLYADFISALMDLQAKRVDAVVIDSVVGEYYMTKKQGIFRELPGSFATEQFGVGVKKGNTALVDLINKGIDKVKASGEGSKISQKWFGKDVMK